MNWFFATLMFSTQVSFAVESDLPLKISSDGRPTFGMQYAYDSSFAWAFTSTSQLSNSEISKLPQNLAWSLVNAQTGQALTPWTDINRTDLAATSLGIRDPLQVAKVLPQLASLKIVFATQPMAALYYVDIGKLCRQHPSQILDLTDMSKPACSVTPQDLPDSSR